MKRAPSLRQNERRHRDRSVGTQLPASGSLQDFPPNRVGDPVTMIREAAQTWLDGGFCVIPPKTDGTKAPLVLWKQRQGRMTTTAELDFWYSRNTGLGVGVICGKVSGNLEMLELEGRANTVEHLKKINQAVREAGAEALWDLLLGEGYCEETPSGGIHILYRIADHDVPGNTKVARRPATQEELAVNPQDTIKTMAETRGEGGFVIVAPSGGAVHPSGRSWNVLAGELGVVPTITWEQRCRLHDAIAAALDEPLPSKLPDNGGTPVVRPTVHHSDSIRPGDLIEDKMTWAQILEPHGWRIHPDRGRSGETLWTRPGKEHRDGHSATTGYSTSGDRLYVFSSSTVFDTETPYNKFAAYALLNHGGNFKQAATALADEYRSELPPRIQPPQPMGTFTPPTTKETAKVPAASDRGKGTQDWTVTGTVNALVARYGQHLRYVHEEKSWRYWDGTMWRRDDEGYRVMELFEVITDELRDEALRLDEENPDKAKGLWRHVNRCRDSGRVTVKSLAASKLTASVKDFDADPRYLNLLNGVYDLVGDVFLEHDPKYMLSQKTNIIFDPAASTQRVEAFFASLLPDDKVRDYFLRSLAYALTGENDRKAFYVMQGMPSCGKTQVAEMMYDFLGGDEGYALTITPYAFMSKKDATSLNTEIHSIQGKRMVFTSETSREMILDEQLIKRLTGKDTMPTRTLYQKETRWRNQAVVFVATNNLPRLASDDEAIWKRVKTIFFGQVFSDDGTTNNVAVPNIGSHLAATESSGLFNLLLVALRQYRSDNRLAEPQEIKDSVAKHRMETDPVARFTAEAQETKMLVEEFDAKSSSRDVYNGYEKWCRDNFITPLGPQRFGVALRAHLKYETARSNGVSYYVGWKWTGPGALHWLAGSHGMENRE